MMSSAGEERRAITVTSAAEAKEKPLTRTPMENPIPTLTLTPNALHPQLTVEDLMAECDHVKCRRGRRATVTSAAEAKENPLLPPLWNSLSQPYP